MRDSDHDRIVRLEERLSAVIAARALQAAEYERRLGELNNEAARISAVLNLSVSAEKFDDYVARVGDALETAAKHREEQIGLVNANAIKTGRELSDAVFALQTWRAAVTARMGVFLGLSILLGGAIGAILARAFG